jgi:hypothetical protein
VTSRRCRLPGRGIPARLVALVVALLVATTLGACTALPSSSPVQAGRGVDENVAAAARIVVPPPAPGDTPEQIVRGFLRAGAAFQGAGDDQEVVGVNYLAPDSVSRWRPTWSVSVYDRASAVTVQAVDATHLRASVTEVATIDDSGHYREVAPGTRAEATFGVVQIQGEWRVVLPESGFGIWVDTDDFSLVFDAYRTYYPQAGTTWLVPDVRWFPTGPRLVTALARAQLGAVPDYLRDVVETGVPDGTLLGVDAVSVDDGVATVTLSAAANVPDQSRRREMWAQFAATLVAAPSVRAVLLKVQGSGLLAVPNVNGAVAAPGELGYAVGSTPVPHPAVLRSGEALRWVDPGLLDELEDPGKPTLSTPSLVTPSAGGGTAASPAGPELPALPAAYAMVAVSRSGEIAAVGAGQADLTRWRGRTQIRVDPIGTALVRPAYDGQDRLWVAGQSDGTPRVWTLDAAVATSSPPDPVEVTWLAGRVVIALAVAPDASRVAILTRAPDDSDHRLDIAGVVRDSRGKPTALAPPYRQGMPLNRFQDVTWVDEVTLAVLGQLSPTDVVRPWVVDLGRGIGLLRVGTTDPQQGLVAAVPGAKWLASTGGVRGLVVVTQQGGVWVRVGSVWRAVPAATDLLVAPLS